jgi:glycerol kinase
MKYILAIDQGTTSTRAILFDKKGRRIRTSQREFSQICPKSGWVLHNPLEIMETVYEVIKSVLNQEEITLDDIETIGVTNQRETTVMWDKTTGKPIYNAIVWQSRQSKEICDKLEDKKDFIYKKTGLLINPYFSASKIKWILDYTNKYEEAKQGNILFGTIDTWILWNLTGLHYTDHTNASRTMLFNINTLEWDDELLELFGIPKEVLPQVKSSSEIYGNVTIKAISGTTKISSLVGDQQASLFGQCAHSYGDVKNTYGTGCFMLMNTKDKIVYSDSGLLTTIAYSINGKVEYALEGSVFVAGAAVQWLRDGIKIIKDAKKTEVLAHASDNEDVYFVPAFVGLGTPYWDDDARGAIFGLTRATSVADLAKATLEAIAFESKDVMEAMVKASAIEINEVSVDGGASANNYLMQFQANLLNKKITRPLCLETTALGAAYLAGLATGYYKDLNDIKKNHEIDKFFLPNKNLDDRYKKWLKAVEATRVFK